VQIQKNQCSCKGKRQGTAVDQGLVLIVRAKKAQQKQDRRHCVRDSQSEEWCAEWQNPAGKTGGEDGEKRRKIGK
jgi:hypothetical protein